MVGIILNAGKGTRMGAATMGITANGAAVSKPLLPIFDKPSTYYALASLIAARIKDILIIAAPDNVEHFRSTLGDGTELGVNISYAIQDEPRGIADAFIIGEEFIGSNNVALTFGDNIFSGQRFNSILRESAAPSADATVFAYHVNNPQDFGVVEFDSSGKAISLEEKPEAPKSNFAVPGIYFYPPEVVEIAKGIKPSARGELEITSVNEEFLNRNKLKVTVLDSDTDWFDTGTPQSLNKAAAFVEDYQDRTGRLLGSPEAEAYLADFITADQLTVLGQRLGKSVYGQRLLALARGEWDM